MLKELSKQSFDIMALHHAEAILTHDMCGALSDLESVLSAEYIPAVELIKGGGGEGQLTQRLRRSFAEKGLKKHNFEIKTIIDGIEKESRSHEVDHVKEYSGHTLALEIEWNNKDPFFDRDLENFKRLHAEGAISAGVIVTRGQSLHENLTTIIQRYAEKHAIMNFESLSVYYAPTARQKKLIVSQTKTLGSFEAGWANAFVKDKFGEATTHWRKLEDRVRRGVGNPCPLLLIGIPDNYVRV